MAQSFRKPTTRTSLLLAASLLLPNSAAQTRGVSFAKTITLPGVLYGSSIAAGDLTHDGMAALGVAADTGDDQLACILLHPLSTAYSNPPWNCRIPFAGYPGSILFADVNLDGNLDVITTDTQGPDTVIAFGDGQGQFSYGDDVVLNFECGPNTPTQAAVADLNHDGIPDIVVIYSSYRNTPGCVAVFLGTGGGQFASPFGFGSGGDEPFDFAVGDLNNDGIPDLVISNYGGDHGVTGNLAVFLGKGDGSFGKPTIYHAPSNEYFFQVILADFNNDGKLDLAFAAVYHREIYVALGNGDGTFASPRGVHVHDGPGYLAAADFNGDGHLDLATSLCTDNEQACGVAVLLGNGDGTFQPQVDFKTPVNPTITIGDFNGDGKPDIATANGDSTVSILLNTTPWPGKKK